MSFLEKMQDGYYALNNYDYVSLKEARSDPGKARQRELYEYDTTRRHNEFIADALEELELTNHPKGQRLFAKAWEMGHSGGYSEVWNYMCDLVELIQ